MILDIDEWSVICSIHQEPRYKFLADELKLAKKMEQDGLLQHIGDKRFSVTKKGESLYEKTNDAQFNGNKHGIYDRKTSSGLLENY